MATAKITIKFEDEQLEELAQRVAGLVLAEMNKDKQPDYEVEVTEKGDPEVEREPIATTYSQRPKTKKDNVKAWNFSPDEDSWDDYEADADELTLHDLTNAELEEVILASENVRGLHKAKMRKDDLVELVEVHYAIEGGSLNELLKSQLYVVAEALGVRDQVTTKMSKADVVAALENEINPKDES